MRKHVKKRVTKAKPKRVKRKLKVAPKRKVAKRKIAPKRLKRASRSTEPKAKINRLTWRTLPGLDTVSDHSGDTNGRALPGRTIRDQLSNLERIAPKRAASGHIYRTEVQKNDSTKRATMFLYIRSSDNTYAVHETLYVSKKRTRSGSEWRKWFNRHAFKGTDSAGTPVEREGIIRGSVLPAVNTKTQKLWSVKSFLGFQTHDLRKPERPKVDKRRHKTKSQGRKTRKGNIRRRHRNSKR